MMNAHCALKHNELCITQYCIQFPETETETETATATVHKLHQYIEDLHIITVCIIRIT